MGEGAIGLSENVSGRGRSQCRVLRLDCGKREMYFKEMGRSVKKKLSYDVC